MVTGAVARLPNWAPTRLPKLTVNWLPSAAVICCEGEFQISEPANAPGVKIPPRRR